MRVLWRLVQVGEDKLEHETHETHHTKYNGVRILTCT
jgi:hypothetical protein